MSIPLRKKTRAKKSHLFLAETIQIKNSFPPWVWLPVNHRSYFPKPFAEIGPSILLELSVGLITSFSWEILCKSCLLKTSVSSILDLPAAIVKRNFSPGLFLHSVSSGRHIIVCTFILSFCLFPSLTSIRIIFYSAAILTATLAHPAL